MPPKAFKPPRPSGGIKKTTTSKPAKTAAKSKSTTRRAAPSKSTSSTSKAKGKASKASPFIQSHNSDDDEDPFSEPVALSDAEVEVDPEAEDEDEVVEDVVVEEDEDEDKAIIPPDLLTKLLHEFFTKDGTRISKDANAAIGRYVDVFVRESLARVVWAKAEGAEGVADNGFCEVEDLEKLAPQLLLDF